MVWWHVYRDYRVFSEKAALEVMTNKVVHFDHLRHLQKTDVKKKLLIYFF